MTLVSDYLRELGRAAVAGWNRFWFTPQDPATLGAIRILAGAMLFYTHLIWSFDLEGFFGPSGWLAPEALDAAYGDARALFWSHWHWTHSPVAMWTAHIAALVIFALLTVGLFTRAVSILAWLLTVSYAHRVMPAALFGLDDINVMLAMYLMIGPSGAAYSLDRWLTRRKGRAGEERALSGSQARPKTPPPSQVEDPPWRRGVGGGSGIDMPRRQIAPSVTANVAIRLMQIHLCIIYLFSGLGKAMGETRR
jgi:hypothetical protein